MTSTESNGNDAVCMNRGVSQSTAVVKCLDESETPSSTSSNIHLDEETEMLLQVENLISNHLLTKKIPSSNKNESVSLGRHSLSDSTMNIPV